MKILFDKLKTADGKVSISLDSGNSWIEYDVSDVVANGIQLDNNQDFDKIQIKGKSKVITNLDVISKIKVDDVQNGDVAISKITVDGFEYTPDTFSCKDKINFGYMKPFSFKDVDLSDEIKTQLGGVDIVDENERVFTPTSYSSSSIRPIMGKIDATDDTFDCIFAQCGPINGFSFNDQNRIEINMSNKLFSSGGWLTPELIGSHVDVNGNKTYQEYKEQVENVWAKYYPDETKFVLIDENFIIEAKEATDFKTEYGQGINFWVYDKSTKEWTSYNYDDFATLKSAESDKPTESQQNFVMFSTFAKYSSAELNVRPEYHMLDTPYIAPNGDYYDIDEFADSEKQKRYILTSGNNSVIPFNGSSDFWSDELVYFKCFNSEDELPILETISSSNDYYVIAFVDNNQGPKLYRLESSGWVLIDDPSEHSGFPGIRILVPFEEFTVPAITDVPEIPASDCLFNGNIAISKNLEIIDSTGSSGNVGDVLVKTDDGLKWTSFNNLSSGNL